MHLKQAPSLSKERGAPQILMIFRLLMMLW